MSSVVADIGSGTVRLGLAGQNAPTHVFSSDGYEAGAAKAVTRGSTFDWTAMEALWKHSFDEKFELESKECPVLLADCPTVKEKDRELMAELLFEKFETPAYFVASQPVLSLYSAGRTNGMVLDAGHEVTHIMAIHEGFAFPHTIGRLDLGGRDMTDNMADLLKERGMEEDGAGLFKTARHIKETHARFALDFPQEALAFRLKPQTAPKYTLPDGKSVDLISEHIRCTESLFQPVLAGCRGRGIADLAWDAIQLCDADRESGPMHALSQFILCVGGTTMIPGLEDRLKMEIDTRAGVQRDIYISQMKQPERHHAAFIGGSILAGLPSFVENNYVSKAEYTEDGAKAVHKRCC